MDDDDLIFNMGNYNPKAYNINASDYGYDYDPTAGSYYTSNSVPRDSDNYYTPTTIYDPVTDDSSYYGSGRNTFLDNLGEQGYTEYYDNLQSTKIENTAKEGQVGYGWEYFSDGTAISPDGKYYYKGKLAYDPSGGSDANAKAILGKLTDKTLDALKSTFTKKDAQGKPIKDAEGNDELDWRRIVGVGGGALAATGLLDGIGGLGGGGKGFQPPQGYQGGIPKYTAVRSAVPITGERPKAGDPGRRYFSDQVYATDENIAKAQADTLNQAQGLAALQQIERKPLPSTAPATAPATATAPTTGLATGGLAGLNAKNGMYLGGPTDGMADKLPATIDGNQEAALSHGEFVIPADVVGHLGNGNSEAGAERLYAMMDKIRMARTGNPKQGKQINPNKFLPA
jgi:hypothetical protein